MSYQIIETYDLEAIHLITTWLWIIAGCFVQFCILTYHIGCRNFIPRPWRFFIILSAFLFLGPTMVYAYSIFLIVSYKLNWQSAPSTEDETRRIINRALDAAFQCKLAEILVESLPQFLTQILMISAKGNEGERVFTWIQWVSVIFSALNIVFGISIYVLNNQGRYMSKIHTQLASSLVIELLVSSEIAFCGGISSFSFAFTMGDNEIPVIATVIPFLAFSSVLSIAPIISDKCRWRFEPHFFLIQKLCIWISIAGLFFTRGSLVQAFRALEINESYNVFLVTMTFTSIVNFTLGFQLREKETTFFLYAWINSAVLCLSKCLAIMPKNVSPPVKMTDTRVVKIQSRLCHVKDVSTSTDSRKIEEQRVIFAISSDASDHETVVMDENISTQRDDYQNPCPETRLHDAERDETPMDFQSPMVSATTNTDESIYTVSKIECESSESTIPSHALSPNTTKGKTQIFIVMMKAKMTSILSESAKKVAIKVRKFLPPFASFLLLFTIGATFLVYPLQYKVGPFHLELECDGGQCKSGIPLISGSPMSKRGYICVKGKSTEEVIKIASVVARQTKVMLVNSTHGEVVRRNTVLTVGDISFPKDSPHTLKKPFLYPSCTGNERYLAECRHYGLAVRIPKSCYEGTSQLYVGPLEGSPFMHQPRHPPFFYFINNMEMNLTQAMETCNKIESVMIGDFEGESPPERPSIPSMIYNMPVGLYNTKHDLAKILDGLNISEIWRGNRGDYLLRSSQMKEMPPGTISDYGKRPVICKVFNRRYQAYCQNGFTNRIPACSRCEQIQPIGIPDVACQKGSDFRGCFCKQFDCVSAPCTESNTTSSSQDMVPGPPNIILPPWAAEKLTPFPGPTSSQDMGHGPPNIIIPPYFPGPSSIFPFSKLNSPKNQTIKQP